MGKVLRPHGRGGLLQIRSYARSEASFKEPDTVFLRLVSGIVRQCRVTSVKRHGKVFLMELEEVHSREEAEECNGAEILVRKEALAREEDEFFWHEILGLQVFLESGESVGRVSRIISAHSNDIYVVEGERETLIPATHEVVKEIDLANQRMVISAMEGLLDLNEV
jgi:16S rRNA processing protein RimM